jgi:hypothetical protein
VGMSLSSALTIPIHDITALVHSCANIAIRLSKQWRIQPSTRAFGRRFRVFVAICPSLRMTKSVGRHTRRSMRYLLVIWLTSLRYFASTRAIFQRGNSCQTGLPCCYPILTQSVDETPLGGYTYAVTCVMELQHPGRHYRSDTIARDGSIDIHFLSQLLNGEIPSLVESCSAVEGTMKRSPKCGKFDTFRYPIDTFRYPIDTY